MPNNDLTHSLTTVMNAFINAHTQKRMAYDRNETAKRVFVEFKTKIASDVAEAVDEKGKPRFSNAEKRAYEVQKCLKIGDITQTAIEAEQAYQQAADMCERAYEQLVTLRALLRFETAELELEAARVNAATAVTGYNDDDF